MTKKTKNWLVVFRMISLVITAVCIILLIVWHIHNKQNIQIQSKLSDYVRVEENVLENDMTLKHDINESNIEQELLNVNNLNKVEESNKILYNNGLFVDFNKLKAINSDVYGWVKIDDTNIDFPIVKANDNNYYLKKNFNKKYNGAGWIFADYRNANESKNKVIYGHNRRNETMFSNLKLLLNDKWFDNENKKYFYFNTIDKAYIAEIFSIYKVDAKKAYIPVEFKDQNEFLNYIEDTKNKSIINFDNTLKPEDEILTLCTCDDDTRYRIVLTAKLIEK